MTKHTMVVGGKEDNVGGSAASLTSPASRATSAKKKYLPLCPRSTNENHMD
jgi:hypothetical protein